MKQIGMDRGETQPLPEGVLVNLGKSLEDLNQLEVLKAPIFSST